jgi:hypothetical protein
MHHGKGLANMSSTVTRIIEAFNAPETTTKTA